MGPVRCLAAACLVLTIAVPWAAAMGGTPLTGTLVLEGVRSHEGRFSLPGINALNLLPPDAGFQPETFAGHAATQAHFRVEGGTYTNAILDGTPLGPGSFSSFGLYVVPPIEHQAYNVTAHFFLLGQTHSDARIASWLASHNVPQVTAGPYAWSEVGAGTNTINGAAQDGWWPFELTTVTAPPSEPTRLGVERMFRLEGETVTGYLHRQYERSHVTGGSALVRYDSGPTWVDPTPSGVGTRIESATYTYSLHPWTPPPLRKVQFFEGEVQASPCILACFVSEDRHRFYVPEPVAEISVEFEFEPGAFSENASFCVEPPGRPALCESASEEPTGAAFSEGRKLILVEDPELLTRVGPWNATVRAAESATNAPYTGTIRIEPMAAVTEQQIIVQPPWQDLGTWWPYWLGPAGLAAGVGAFVRLLRRYKPVQFFLFVALFTRLERNEVLDNEHRAAILAYLSKHPGRSFADIRRELSLGSGSVAHHLRVLEKQDFVKGVRDGLRTRFFLRGARIEVDAYLSHTQESILHAIENNPGIRLKDLARLVGLPRQNVGYHTRKLAELGKLRRESEGTASRHWPT